MAQGKEGLGIEASKADDFPEWYQQVVVRGELIEYSDVSGCYILRPNAYRMWELIRDFFDGHIRQMGVENAYFPLFIPESLLGKESDHVEGFVPEVAWVTHAGETELNERLAVRPTSETVMYPSYAKWIRSHKDLPLRLNQWNNVVRWEFKDAVPFLRSREFLWQEGHTAHATEEGADEEVRAILDLYARVYEELLAVPVIKGRKSDKEKFAGADYTTSIETFLPHGKAIQCATSHGLGQNFSTIFDITFLDEDEQERHVWQNSWGLTTRSIGVAVMMHGDDRGLVLPPRVAPVQVVVVPIYKTDSREAVLEKAEAIRQTLAEAGLRVRVDARDDYNPGWKFHAWELRGVPVRLEVGPRDLEEGQVVLVRRDSGDKDFVPDKEMVDRVEALLDAVHDALFERAAEHIEDSTVVCEDWWDFQEAIAERKLVKAPWCTETACEDEIKWKTEGGKSLVIPFEQDDLADGAECAHCDRPATVWAYFAKSY